MKSILLLALLWALSMEATVLVSSGLNNTIITSPSNKTVVIEKYHTTNNFNYISYNAQWLWKAGGESWPSQDTVVFRSQFYADCQSPATLIITADNIFYASLNGGSAYTGNDWTKKYQFTLSKLTCGINILIFTVINKDPKTPAALIFAVIQDQTNCYGCKSLLSYYNLNTCRC
jgi:hypothetical protein